MNIPATPQMKNDNRPPRDLRRELDAVLDCFQPTDKALEILRKLAEGEIAKRAA